MSQRPAMPYARALFALAKEIGQVELVGRELAEAAATFGSVAELRDCFARPWIPATEKGAVAAAVAQRSGWSKLTRDFLALAAGRGRTDHLAAIAEQYQRMVDEDLRRLRARVAYYRPAHERGVRHALGQAGAGAGRAAGAAGRARL